MDPLIVATAAEFVSQIAGWLGSGAERKKWEQRLEQFRQMYEGDRAQLMGMVGKQPYNPGAVAAAQFGAEAPMRRRVSQVQQQNQPLDWGAWGSKQDELGAGRYGQTYAAGLRETGMTAYDAELAIKRLLSEQSKQLYGETMNFV